MAISMVSPKRLYLSSLYAMTCVLPPETYNTTGSTAPVTARPISMCAMQWLTLTSGFPQRSDRARAAAAATWSDAPMPGPLV